MTIPIYQVDAFAKRLFEGNPAAVCPLQSWLPDAVMQSIAAENNLAETAFFVPQGEGFHIRWFTPTVEVRLCGHATLASAKVIYDYLGWNKAEIHFHSLSGMLRVFREDDMLFLDFPADELHPVEGTPMLLKDALKTEFIDLYKGITDYMVVVPSEEEVSALQPDFRLLAEMTDIRGVIVTAPGKETDFVSRCFYSPAGIDEDPVTGSAHTTLTPYWAQRLRKDELTARQLSQRGGSLLCRLKGERVEIGGYAVVYMQGEVMLD